MQGSRDIVIAHPNTQHSAELARALLKLGRLNALVTRLQIGASPSLPWSLSWVQSRVSRRIDNELPDGSIRRIRTPQAVIQRLAMPHIPQTVAESWGDRERARFQQAVIPRIGEASTVIGFSRFSGHLFSYLSSEAPHVRRVLDLSHPPDAVVQDLIRMDSAENNLNPEHYDDYRSGAPIDQTRELALADLIIVASNYSASTLGKMGVDPSKIRIVPYASKFQPPSTTPSDMARGDVFRLLFVGALSERKGLTLLLRCMAELAQASTPIRLDIVGKPSGLYRLPQVLPPNTHFHRAPGSDVVRDLMRRAHRLVLPSMCEGYGRVLLEALSMGTGVLTTERSGAPDIAAEFPDAPVQIVPTGGRDQLASVIGDLIHEPQWRHSAAATHAASRFTEERYAADLSAALAGRSE